MLSLKQRTTYILSCFSSSGGCITESEKFLNAVSVMTGAILKQAG